MIDSPADAPPEPLCPLTERILARLRMPHALAIALWAAVPWLNAAANLALGDTDRSAIWEQSPLLVVLNYAALSIGIVLALWGTRRLTRRLTSLGAATSLLAGGRTRRFGGMNSTAGPLVAATATSLAFAATALVRDGWAPALLRGLTWFVLGVALWTFLWVYGSVLLGLHRVGREQLVAETAIVDPGLGLRPLGALAFMGLWMVLAWLVPVILTGLSDLLGFVIGMLVLAGALAAFFLSLYRLHRQMAQTRARELAVARDLYAQAYEPLRASPTLEGLDRQRALLAAADALEKRAGAIHEWPIDEGTFARVVTITTSVVAMAIARLILDPLGL